ncbi:hypothetical protein C482_18287 [Natrialba chahannaoensis JCM 10990]|uniref:Uncharacterized protein n=1 Tax=Natrialba chahannaoensis JCM 10990 TaxID=1227492 RepID=M0A6T9_9EURY|nr:hypothetical protein [Natrialba chahannaoensis]ELY94284.1 hypothetical protein C482_18287 [Natrialba chahannaoensis JCM 10990]
MDTLGRSDENEYATLQRLPLANIRDMPIVAELRIEQAETDDVIFTETYELPAAEDGFEAVSVDCVWPDDPLRVMTRDADTEDWVTLATADRSDCLSLLAELHGGGVSYYSSTDECPIRALECHGE